MDWTSRQWRDYSLFDQKIAAQFTQKVYVFSDSVLSLGGKRQEHPDAANTRENDRIREFGQSPAYQPCHDITGIVEDLRGKDDD